MAAMFQGFIISPVCLLWILSGGTGIFLLWKVLSRFFEMPVVLITAFLILFGTNYFHQIIFAGPAANAFLFTLFLAMIYLTGTWQQGMRWIPLLVMFPVMLTISFLSAPAMFIFLFPVAAWMDKEGYGIRDTGYGGNGKRLLSKGAKQVLFLAGIIITCMVLRQFSWFSDPGSGFYFGDPAKARFPIVPSNIHRVLFSVKNGWLVYTPLMALAFTGFYFLAEKNKAVFWPAFLFLLAALISAASNPAWWFDDRFGYPNLVETYAVMCLPLGYFIQWVFTRKMITRILLFMVVFLFVSLNLFQSLQFNRSVLLPGRMTWPYYAATFAKTVVTPGNRMLLEPGKPGRQDVIPAEKRIKCSRVAGYDFEEPMGGYDPFRLERAAHSGKFGIVLNSRLRFSPGLTIRVRQLTERDSSWLNTTGYVFFTCKNAANKVFLVTTCVHKGLPYKYKITDCSDARFHANQWNKVTMSYLVPAPIEPDDLLQVYFMNYGLRECRIDDMEINLCKPAP
jgi:hypothetical protein